MSVILVDKSHPSTTVITLNRADKKNALSIELMQALTQVVKDAASDKTQKFLVLKASGSVFCAGLDLKEAMDPSLEETSSKALSDLLNTLYDTPLITIVAIHGAAYAGGLGLVSVCDLAVADAGTVFALPETRRGLVAAQIMPYILRLIPQRFLMELTLIGDAIDAEKALQIGLINHISSGYAFKYAMEWVDKLSKNAPNATRLTKNLIRSLECSEIKSASKDCLDIHRQVRSGNEAKEGMQSFVEKRAPVWKE